MTRTLIILLFIAALSVGLNLYLLGSRDTDSPASGQTAELYVCPMHPQVQQDHPADCPICGMKLVKRSALGDQSGDADSLAAAVHLSPSQELLANVRTERPTRRNIQSITTSPAVIVAKEESQWTLSLKVEGRIERIHVQTPGESVTKGQSLFEFFSPELARAQREYLILLSQPQVADSNAVVNSARERLFNLGMEEKQIEHLQHSGEVRETLTFHAPRSGILLQRMATEGDWIMPPMKVLEFADLQTVWAEAAIYETQLSQIRRGDEVELLIPGDASFLRTAEIDYISPAVNPENRTVAIRATVPNSDDKLKPDMFAQMRWSHGGGNANLTVPENAVLATGRSQRVWVKISDGRFQPREVVIGARSQGYIEILEGLQERDEVAVNGGYLIDSDAQLKNIGTAPPTHHPEPKSAVPAGEVSYVCPMNCQPSSASPGKCAVCGMNLVKKEH